MDRPGVRHVPEDSGEQGKMEKTGCKIICGAPTTHVVKGLMIIMMMMMMMNYVTKHQRTPLCLYRAVLWWKGDLLFVWHTYVGSPILPLAFTSCRRLPSSAPRRMVKRRLSWRITSGLCFAFWHPEYPTATPDLFHYLLLPASPAPFLHQPQAPSSQTFEHGFIIVKLQW